MAIQMASGKTIEAPEKAAAAETELTEPATDALLSELLGDPSQEIIEPIEIMVGERTLKLGVKHLSQREVSAILRKRMRSVSGKLTPAADADIILKCHALAECIYKNAGSDGVPVWVKLWSFEDVAGGVKRKGLIDNPSENAQELQRVLLEEINIANNNQLNAVFLDAMDKVLTESAQIALQSV